MEGQRAKQNCSTNAEQRGVDSDENRKSSIRAIRFLENMKNKASETAEILIGETALAWNTHLARNMDSFRNPDRLKDDPEEEQKIQKERIRITYAKMCKSIRECEQTLRGFRQQSLSDARNKFPWISLNDIKTELIVIKEDIVEDCGPKHKSNTKPPVPRVKIEPKSVDCKPLLTPINQVKDDHANIDIDGNDDDDDDIICLEEGGRDGSRMNIVSVKTEPSGNTYDSPQGRSSQNLNYEPPLCQPVVKNSDLDVKTTSVDCRYDTTNKDRDNLGEDGNKKELRNSYVTRGTIKRNAKIASSVNEGNAGECENKNDNNDKESSDSEPASECETNADTDFESDLGPDPSWYPFSKDGDPKFDARPQSSSTSGVQKPVRKRKLGRRNIRKVMKKSKLSVSSKIAELEERQRKSRVSARIAKMNEVDEEVDELVLDRDPETMEALVSVDRSIVRKLKPHQKEGIRFMWNACFESVEQFQKSKEETEGFEGGGGCILAHAMGLGKTVQATALIHTAMTSHHLQLKTVLVLCPLNAVENWAAELLNWIPLPRDQVEIHPIYSIKSEEGRLGALKKWRKRGGIAILNYDAYKALLSCLLPNLGRVQTEKNTTIIEKCFCDPGPSLVIFDEGHVIKNENSQLYAAVSKLKTKRRIILTGTPLQNELREFYNLIQLVKPDLLGTSAEFLNRFVNPIKNGQYNNSTDKDVHLMKQRALVLHELLDGCVLRGKFSLMEQYLPRKYEYDIFIRMTPIQKSLYEHYVRRTKNCTSSVNIHSYRCLQPLVKILNHPLALALQPKDEENNFLTEVLPSNGAMKLEDGSKLMVLLGIIQECERMGDKVLVFSQFLYVLDMIERLLKQQDGLNIAKGSKRQWTPNTHYFRIDGSTPPLNRQNDIGQFNKKNSRAKLFLISTKAGGMGVNLVGANRVVIFDSCWNPSRDLQAIFRICRIGQEKTCFVYRLIAKGTVEENIYNRQIVKLSLASRVVDKLQIKRYFAREDTCTTLSSIDPDENVEDDEEKCWETQTVPKDDLLRTLLVKQKQWVHSYKDHEILLQNQPNEKLTDKEGENAWKEWSTLQGIDDEDVDPVDEMDWNVDDDNVDTEFEENWF